MKQDKLIKKHSKTGKIFSLDIKTGDKTKYLIINNSDIYNLSSWTIKKAIANYENGTDNACNCDSWYQFHISNVKRHKTGKRLLKAFILLILIVFVYMVGNAAGTRQAIENSQITTIAEEK